jgi:SAM-dependent methyltransferase
MIEYDSDTGEVDSGREASAESQRNSDILANAEAICKGRLGMNFSYETWKDIGMEFGPTFRNLTDMQVGDGSGIALCTVTIPEVAKVMPKNFLHPHTIQPATLDSILQTFMMAIADMKKSNRLRKPELPTFIKKVWISSSIPNTPGQDFKCFSEAEQISATQYLTRTTVWDATTRKLGLKLSGIETKTLETDVTSSANTTEDTCYFVEWQPVVNLLSNMATVFQNMLPSSSFDLAAHRAHVKRCQIISMRYIEETMRTIKEIDSTKLSTHHQKYLDWLKCQAAKISTPGPFLLEDAAALDRARQNPFESVDQPSAREELLHKLGSKIKPILCGEADALELMFNDGDLMDRFYSETSAPGNITPLLKSFLNALSHNSPGLNIIEIGAGTGSTTATILEVLSPNPAASLLDDSESSTSRIANYTYTDVSAGFFKRGKQRFADWAGLMEFKTLDIESSPAEQGIEVGRYDLVVASNVDFPQTQAAGTVLTGLRSKVLHATSCLADTLTNARSLLKRLVIFRTMSFI